MKLDGKENCGDLLTKHLAKEAMVYLMNKAGDYHRDGRNPQAPTLVEGAAKARLMMIMVGSILLEKIGFTTATSDNDYKTYYETSVVETKKEYTKYEWFCMMMLTFVVGALIRYAARVMIDEAMIALIKK